MTQNKFTPGEWEVIERTYPQTDYTKEKTCFHVLKDGKRLTEEGEEGKANAHLIAAAPDLLEALEKIVEHCYGNMSLPDYVFTAIAKAKGGAR